MVQGQSVAEKSYEDGLRDGELRSLKIEVVELKRIVEELTRDVRAQGRIIWMLCGALVLAQFIIPIVSRMIK